MNFYSCDGAAPYSPASRPHTSPCEGTISTSSSKPALPVPTRPSVQCHLGWQATLLATLITLALLCVTDLTQHQGPVTLSSLILLPAFPQGLRGAQTYSRGSGAAPTGKMVLTGNGAHPESHQRRTCRCPRSGIPLGRGSCSLSCPASRKHPGPEEKQRRKQESRIREEQWSLLAWKAAWRRQWRGTSLRDLPESGPGRKTAETPEGSVQGPRRGPRRLT